MGRHTSDSDKIRDHVWYIKWASAFTILCAMILHVFGITPWNSIVQMIGASGWVYVGFKWKEKALITNFLPQFAIIIPALCYMFLTK
jgi:hypothetical protein